MSEREAMGWSGCWGRAARYHGLGALFHLAAGEQDAPPARQAFQADVRAQAHHPPLVAAARMRLTQTEDVVEAKVEGHGKMGTEVNPLPRLYPDLPHPFLHSTPLCFALNWPQP